MSSLFDFDKPAMYAVMGNPIDHSKSPRIHRLFAEQTGQHIDYTAIQVDPGGFEQAVHNFQGNGGLGLNVTVPFKREAWRLCDQRETRAELAEAVNTLVFRQDGAIQGDNTDGVGLIRDLKDHHHTPLQGARILVLGAGGAARGVLGPLLEEALPAQLVLANRTVDTAVTVADHFARLGPIEGCGYDDLEGYQFELIINATAASMKGGVPPLPETILADGGWCYDMMYSAEPTPFMVWAEEHEAAKIMDGLGMLVEQAAESFLIWRGVRPETASVIAALRSELEAGG